MIQVLDRLRTVIWLRWRMGLNQTRKSGKAQTILTIIVVVGAALSVISAFVGSLFASFFMMPHIEAEVLLLVWNVLVLVFIGAMFVQVIMDLQQSETISLQNFLHLPVSPFHAFLLNFFGSFFNLMTLLIAPPMLGFAAMHWVGFGWPSLFVPVLFVTFFVMVMAFTYQVRSWISVVVVDKRKRRAIWAAGTLVIILASQFPVFWQASISRPARRAAKLERQQVQAKIDELVKQVEADEIDESVLTEAKQKIKDERAAKKKERRRAFMNVVRQVDAYVPFGWLALGIHQTAKGNLGVSILCFFGMSFFAAASLRSSYKTTLRLYRGDIRRRKKVVAPSQDAGSSKDVPPKYGLPGRSFPMLTDSQSAIVGATLAGFLRDPGTRMVVASPVLIVVIAMFAALSQLDASQFHIDLRGTMGLGIGVMIIMGLSALKLNQFGFDRNGFRTYIFSPVERRDILIAKNLAPLPIGIAIIALAMVGIQIFMPMRVTHLFAGFFGFLSLYFLISIFGNFISIFAPCAIKPGTSQPQNMKVTTILIQFSIVALLPSIVVPIALPFGIEYLTRNFLGSGIPVAMICNVVVLPIAIWLYLQATKLQGRLLQSREIKILEAVTIKGT